MLKNVVNKLDRQSMFYFIVSIYIYIHKLDFFLNLKSLTLRHPFGWFETVHGAISAISLFGLKVFVMGRHSTRWLELNAHF